MDYYEDLAKVIFNHVHSAPDCPVAEWDRQPQSVRAPYIKAAQVATITMSEHNTFNVEMVCKEPETVSSYA